jgi:SAM-dependent methyltransferase
VSCAHLYRETDDVVDCLFDPHPAVVRERNAVHQLDLQGHSVPEQAQDILKRLASNALTEEDLAQSAHTRVIAESRKAILDLLAREPLSRSATVLEVGADSGWTSSILLNTGVRVVATDITDHLFLAPDGSSPNLCRLQADMNRLPLRDGTIDVVFGASCVHHSWDLGTTCRELARVLKPAGVVYFCGEPMPSMVRFVLERGFGHKERAIGINENWIRRAVWLGHLRDAGLEPRILFPVLTNQQLAQRLQKRRLPGLLAPVIRPLLPLLQVSVHLRADKVTLTNTERGELARARKHNLSSKRL